MVFVMRHKIDPLPLEKELSLRLIRDNLKDLTREQLEENLARAIDAMVRLTHQTKQLVKLIEKLEGKNP